MLFPTTKRESRKSRWIRLLFNLSPTYRGSRGRITFISGDFKEVHVRLKLNLFTRNYVGTIYGGSLYSSLDPIYMLMLMRILGDEYVVWDKAATIRFVRPGKTILRARFLIDDDRIALLRSQIEKTGELDAEFAVQYIDQQDAVVTEVMKTIYIADKKVYKEKRALKNQSAAYRKMF